jgi:hypothetical protein
MTTTRHTYITTTRIYIFFLLKEYIHTYTYTFLPAELPAMIDLSVREPMNQCQSTKRVRERERQKEGPFENNKIVTKKDK